MPKDLLTDTVAVKLASLVGTAISNDTSLMSAGLDSIAAAEFTNSVSDAVGISVSAIMLFDHPTLDSIASYLAIEL